MKGRRRSTQRQGQNCTKSGIQNWKAQDTSAPEEGNQRKCRSNQFFIGRRGYTKHRPARSEVDLNEDDLLLIGNQRRKNQEDQSEGDSKKTSLPPRSKSPLIYTEFEEERRRELTSREKPSHQRSTSGNHQYHHSHDQGQGRLVHLKPRATSSHQSASASISFLDFGQKLTVEGRHPQVALTETERSLDETSSH